MEESAYTKKITIRRKKYRSFLGLCLALCGLAVSLVWQQCIVRRIPESILLYQNEEQRIDFGIPVSADISISGLQETEQKMEPAEVTDDFVLSWKKWDERGRDTISTPVTQTLAMKGSSGRQYQMGLKLYGVVPVKSVSVKVISPQSLYLSGEPVGIYLKTKGVLVIDTGSFPSVGQTDHSPAHEILQSGDYILKVGGKEISSKKDLIAEINKCDGRELVFTILRNGEISEVALTPEKDVAGTYKAGIWVRDSAQGIGTVTYLTEEGNFGALGHGINDSDTATLMHLGKGSIYATSILSISRGETDHPGQLTGILTFEKNDYLGKIEQNSDVGIFGRLESEKKVLTRLTEDMILCPVALKQEVKKGKAQIYCDVDGEPDFYEIEIEQLYFDGGHDNQGILLTVTDERLLSVTGGIVQGMSGSPIIQNGKIIGAVTHVFVKDATKGYGVFIEKMLEH